MSTEQFTDQFEDQVQDYEQNHDQENQEALSAADALLEAASAPVPQFRILEFRTNNRANNMLGSFTLELPEYGISLYNVGLFQRKDPATGAVVGKFVSPMSHKDGNRNIKSGRFAPEGIVNDVLAAAIDEHNKTAKADIERLQASIMANA